MILQAVKQRWNMLTIRLSDVQNRWTGLSARWSSFGGVAVLATFDCSLVQVYPFVHGRIVEVGSGNKYPELSCAALAEKRQAATRELFQHFDEAKPFIGKSITAAH